MPRDRTSASKRSRAESTGWWLLPSRCVVTKLSSSRPTVTGSTGEEGVPMTSVSLRPLLACFGLALTTSVAAADDVTGAGASFPAPIYAKWADTYNKATGARINYQSVGSGAGIKQIIAKTVDFGASDMPLKDDELAR